jgi:hypothetical protein
MAHARVRRSTWRSVPIRNEAGDVTQRVTKIFP